MAENSLVATDWLETHLGDSDLRVLDGSWYLSAAGRNAKDEFAAGHLPGAQFFDIDAIADRSTNLPHMLPAPEVFAAVVGALGIGNDDRVVVYDGAGLFSAPRVWWTFRVFGHDRIAVLDGGLPKWKREGRRLETAVATPNAKKFSARFRPELVRSLDAMKAILHTHAEQVLDARSSGRFLATEPEPRASLRRGHIPGSKNLPFNRIVRPDGTLLELEALRRVFEAEIDLEAPLVTTCGSGITASLLAFGLDQLGKNDVAVYDGSWSEWGGRDDTPIEP